MATENERDGCLVLESIAADWDYRASKPTDWPDNPRLNSIEFHPGAADNVMVVKQGNDTGPERFYCECKDVNDSRIKYYHGARVMPYIDFGDCTLNAGHKVIIELWREP